MTAYEALLLNAEMLNRLSSFGIKLDDCENIQLYRDYLLLRKENSKISYIVPTLAYKYKRSERSVYRAIKRCDTLCQNVVIE